MSAPRPPALRLAPRAARRFALLATRLTAPLPDVAAALDHLGYAQLDPIDVCGRMHDLVLRNRVAGYRAGDLLRHVHGPEGAPLPAPARRAFEQVLPRPHVLAVLPLEAWPHLLPVLEERRARRTGYGRRLSAAEERLAARVLAELAARGPLAAEDIAHDGRAVTAWGSRGRLVRAVLDRLFYQGRVLLAGRRDFRRRYDLPGRVLPAAALRAPRPAAEETRRWHVLLRLRQRRLVALPRADAALVADRVLEVRIEGCPPCHLLREDAPLLEAARAAPDGAAPVRLLAPLDPLVYDRRLTAALWDFPYTWEVYTPPARRVRGYYALPVLAGARLAGHVEPRADREGGRLRVVSRRVARGVAVAPALRELAGFLGVQGP